MKKVFGTDIQLQKILELARINSDFIEATIQYGIVIIQPKRLCCAWCGSDKEIELKLKNGILLCQECAERRDADASIS